MSCPACDETGFSAFTRSPCSCPMGRIYAQNWAASKRAAQQAVEAKEKNKEKDT